MKQERQKVKNKKRTLVRLIAAILLLAGVGVAVYPHALQFFYNQQAQGDYERFMEKLPASADPGETGMPYSELYQQMRAYNDKLYTNGQSELVDPWAYEQASFNLAEYGFEEDVIGYIEISKIDVILPVYLGASEENMRKGAVHLSQTSLPIGGKNTNCVIAGHSNYYSARLFTDLVKLTQGDTVTVTNLWETMTYKVTDTTTILANEADKLKIQEGKELLSLFTCFDQSGRRDRFVAYCERVG